MKKKILYILIVVACFSSCDINLPIDKTATETENQGTFIDQRDGQVYHYKQFGNTVWMTDNLRYLPNSFPANNYTPSDIEARYYLYGYNGTDINFAREMSQETTQGILYNYSAARLSVPDGWRLPTRQEFADLFEYVEKNYQGAGISWPEGVIMAMTSPFISHVAYSWETIRWEEWLNYPNFAASGFNMLASGYYDYEKGFKDSGRVLFWTAEMENSAKAYAVTQDGDDSWAYLGGAYSLPIKQGFSVRCVKK